MIKYLIIDDEYIAHDIIQEYADMLPNLQLVKNCYNAIEAIDFLNNNEVDLIFLDLNMPKLSGFQFLRTLVKPPKVIVTTAYSEHALEGYELNILDYLLKPFSFERFLKAINKVLITAPPKNNKNESTDSSSPKSIFLKSNKKYVQITIDEIQFIEAAGNYSKINFENEIIMVREKISDLLITLTATDMLQVHKSFAVSKKYIKSIEGNRIHIGKESIPIGKYYKMKVNDLLS